MRPDRSVIHQNINGAKMSNTGFCDSFCFGLIANIAHRNKRCDAMRAHLISDRLSGVTIAAAIDDGQHMIVHYESGGFMHSFSLRLYEKETGGLIWGSYVPEKFFEPEKAYAYLAENFDS